MKCLWFQALLFVAVQAQLARAEDAPSAPPAAGSEAAAPAPEAAAPEAAPAPPPPGLTLRKGALQITVTGELEMTKDRVGKPFSIAPDVSYGVTDDLTVSLVHSKYGVTGFRAAVGGGLCVTGTDNGCAKVYNNVGAEAWLGLARGELALAVSAGVHAMNLDAGYYDAKLAARARWSAGPVAVTATPSVLIAMTKRSDDAGARLNKDLLYVPVLATYKVAKPVSLGVGSGLKGPLSGFGDAWEVPLGAVVTYALDARWQCGASWVFGKLIGGAPDPGTGVDFRGAQFWVTANL